MNLEQTLIDELESTARALDVPPPPAAADLVRHAEQARTRGRARWTVTTVLAAAAVVAAVLAGLQIGRPDAGPRPTRPTPTKVGFPVGAPLHTYVDPTTNALYIGGVVEQGNDWMDATTYGDLTLGYLGQPVAGDVVVFLHADKLATIHPTGVTGVKVSPDAHTIAWEETKGRSGTIVVAQVSASGLHELGRLSVPALARVADDESRELLIEVADDGTVTYGGTVDAHTWKPGGSPKPADPSSYLYRPAGFPARADDIDVNRSGSWGAWLTDEWDPGTGGGEARYRSVTFQQPGKPDTRARIQLPAGDDDARSLYWESDTDLVIGTYTGNQFVHVLHEYVRCNVLTRACEVAPGPGTH